MLNQKLTGQQAADKTYIEDVFSTYLYTGNGSTQTITNGIDLAGKGGMVWVKKRSATSYNILTDTARGVSRYLATNTTGASVLESGQGVTAFNSNGFTATYGGSSGYDINNSGDTEASWTFRKAPKFFDVVTYTGTGALQNIAHSLGQVPGMIIVKSTSTTGDWVVYHRSLGATKRLFLNTTDAQNTSALTWNDTEPTSSVFTVGIAGSVNTNGATYVAYLFAHDTTTDGLIQCGSYTGTGAAGNEVILGWEPQYLLVKVSSSSSSWWALDDMRGGGLQPNSASAESPYVGFPTLTIQPTARGFKFVDATLNDSGQTFIYMAIRRGPMKTPTDGTKVFSPVAYTGTGANQTITTPNFAPDSVWWHIRQAGNGYQNGIADKLRNAWSIPNATDAEYGPLSTGNVLPAFTNTGFTLGAGNNANASGSTYGSWSFQRAPGFFDVVCYTSAGGESTLTHNLQSVPELIIKKRRSGVSDWFVWHKSFNTATGQNCYLNGTAAVADWVAEISFQYPPTATDFKVREYTGTGAYVAYLFASCPGVSKVGSYDGTESSQTISCGFSGGARFVLIKCVNKAANWVVYDTVRGMVSGTSPYLSLNSTTAELNRNDVYTTIGGFQVSGSARDVNETGCQYIYLAIA